MISRAAARGHAKVLRGSYVMVEKEFAGKSNTHIELCSMGHFVHHGTTVPTYF
jgi:hypothetical protein